MLRCKQLQSQSYLLLKLFLLHAVVRIFKDLPCSFSAFVTAVLIRYRQLELSKANVYFDMLCTFEQPKIKLACLLIFLLADFKVLKQGKVRNNCRQYS